jgi:1-deoxy-D-xylulose-5-phosphate reductoisomerase
MMVRQAHHTARQAQRKRVTILGSTGSVGISTLDVIAAHPGEFKVAGLAAGSNAQLMESQIKTFKPEAVYLRDGSGALQLKKKYPKLKIFSESDNIHSFAGYLDADILMTASTGTSALLSVLDALKKGKRVALANKEILVMAGSLVMEALKKNKKAELIPVDSEHSAIFQCLQGSVIGDVSKLVLTGSGGPLREVAARRFSKLSVQEVINHPKWKMGKKISVDSATLMNKGLELIEAAWMFGLPIDKIEVLIHPEAVIHSMVEFKDGSMLAQLGVTDMKGPIRYALSYPRRLEADRSMKLDLAKIGSFTFTPPDTRRFPCLGLAVEAAKRSGSAPCVLSAADEVAVQAFLTDKIPFVDIPKVIENVLSQHRHIADPDLDQIQTAHAWAVEKAGRLCKAL